MYLNNKNNLSFEDNKLNIHWKKIKLLPLKFTANLPSTNKLIRYTTSEFIEYEKTIIAKNQKK